MGVSRTWGFPGILHPSPHLNILKNHTTNYTLIYLIVLFNILFIMIEIKITAHQVPLGGYSFTSGHIGRG